MKAVVILPTYNERENILPMLEALGTVCRKIYNHSFEFVVVDDNSPDGTSDLVRGYQKKHKNVKLLSGEKEGLGKALLRAMRYAILELGAECIAQLDADLSHDPSVLPLFFKEIDNGADFVVGSRYIPGGSIPENWALYRKIYSVVGNAIVRFGLGQTRVHDWTGGYRVYKSTYVRVLEKDLEAYSGYVFQIAFLHKSIERGAHVAEVPIHFTDRRFGRSKIAPSEYIRNVLIYVGKARVQSLFAGTFGKFLVVGSVGFVINTAILEALVYLGFYPTIGSVVGAEVAIISNFILNNYWTFRAHKIEKGAMVGKFFQFNLTSVGAVVLQAASVAVGTFLFGVMTYRMWYLIGVSIGLVWNYVMYRSIIWKTK